LPPEGPPIAAPKAPVAAHTLEPIAATEQKVHELRADAQRNRERIIAAAIEVFAEHGLDASTAVIAHRAGVGEATLFRRFPSKDDLIQAIVETQMEAMIEIATDCLNDPDAGAGFERFLYEMVERSTGDRGVLEAAKDQCMMNPELDDHRRAIVDAMTALVKRAQAAGVVRADLAGTDLGLLINAASSTADLPFPGLRDDLWKRYLRIIIDGLRPEGATKLRPGPPPRRLFENPTSD
jgi:AcrR family transcriptional regulator